MRKFIAAVVMVLALGACTPQQAINFWFPEDVSKATSVADCESEMDVNAISPTNDHGLFQINEPTWNHPGHADPPADWIGRHWHHRYNAWWNAAMARQIVDKYGWGMWTCS